VIRPQIAVPALLLLLGGCAGKTGEIDESGGITAVRSGCPQIGVPSGTGDITLFNPSSSREASAIDIVAAMTNVDSHCDDDAPGADVISNVSFVIQARRTHTEDARDVTLPFFVTVVQGGSQVVSKRIGHVTVHFDAGQDRAQAAGQGVSFIAKSATTLPRNVREQLLRKRKAGEDDAAVDPLAQPEVRGAVLRATYETLVGFQLTDDQLKYNVTR
jgi:hypothetical protein